MVYGDEKWWFSESCLCSIWLPALTILTYILEATVCAVVISARKRGHVLLSSTVMPKPPQFHQHYHFNCRKSMEAIEIHTGSSVEMTSLSGCLWCFIDTDMHSSK